MTVEGSKGVKRAHVKLRSCTPVFPGTVAHYGQAILGVGAGDGVGFGNQMASSGPDLNPSPTVY